MNVIERAPLIARVTGTLLTDEKRSQPMGSFQTLSEISVSDLIAFATHDRHTPAWSKPGDHRPSLDLPGAEAAFFWTQSAVRGQAQLLSRWIPSGIPNRDATKPGGCSPSESSLAVLADDRVRERYLRHQESRMANG
jgi:hypothetical protein